MEEKLLELQRNNNECELRNYVASLDIDEVCSRLQSICSKENGLLILQIILGGLSDSASCQQKRMTISKAILHEIELQTISSKLSEKLVSVLAMQMESLSVENIITLIDTSLNMLRQSREADACNYWKDLIPKLLNKIIEYDEFEHNGSNISGIDYKKEIVIAICLINWPSSIISNVANMFVDMPLSREEHKKVVNKLCQKMSQISLQELPPLVYQVLQLTKEENFMSLFLALREIFDQKIYSRFSESKGLTEESSHGNDLKDLQATESTVLYHIYSVVSSLGPQSVKDFLKTLRECVNSPQFVLSPFSVTLLLTISCISYTFEEEVLGLLKAAILRCVTEKEWVSDSAWIETMVPPQLSIEDLFSVIIDNCFRDRDKILKGLVNLGFSLLSTCKLRGRESLYDTLWSLGSEILVKLIKKYEDVTSSILQTLANQISQFHDSTQYTDCLLHVVRKSPLNLLDCSPVLIQLLDNICSRLPGNVGQRLVAVILPLTKMSQSLRDNLIMVLRKSMFPNDKACRAMAVSSILELLKDFKISNMRNLSQSLSQNYCGLTQIYSETSTGPTPSHSNEGLCLELLSILREVFKHEHEIRTVYYRGVYEAVCCNRELGCHVMDGLQKQLNKFYRPGNDIPPLDFDSTVKIQGTSVVIQEPIAQLILSVGLIVAQMEEGSSRSSKMTESLDSMCQRMADSDVPNFLFDQEIFDGSPENQAKEELIRQALGVYESLMGYVLCSWTAESVSKGQTLNSLFKGYMRLSDFAKGLGKSDKKKSDIRGRVRKMKETQEKSKDKVKVKLSFKFPTTVLNFKCACRLLCLLYEPSLNWASEESLVMVKNKRELHRYCLSVVLNLVKKAQSMPKSELARNTADIGYLTKIGRVLFMRCIRRLEEVKEFDLNSAVASVECFSELLHLISIYFKKKLPNIFASFTDVPVEDGFLLQIKCILDSILDGLQAILSETPEGDQKEEEMQHRKLCILLISSSSILIGDLPRGEPETQQVLDKIKKICQETKVAAPNVARSLLNLFLTLQIKCKPSGSLLMDLALCLCDNMSLIDEELEVEQHNSYAIINERSANSCLMSISDALRILVGEIERVVSRLKAELLIMSLSSKEREENLYEKEKELCRHINFSMKILSIMCTIAVPPGVYADAVLKEMGNFYNKMTLVTKYFILKTGKYHHQLQHSKFDKTVKMIDHELSKNMYCFTEHVIGSGDCNAGRSAMKKDATFLKNKCLKETKIIPKVIYEKEQFQKFIMQLSNKCKINLVTHIKHAMARDYRLYTKQVKEILEKENMPDREFEGMEAEIEESEKDQTEEHSSKKPRMSDESV